MADLAQLQHAVETGDAATASAITRAALDEGTAPKQVLDAMKAAMDTVGAGFQNGEVFVPEMLISAHAMKEGLAILEPVLVATGVVPEYTAVIGTIQGDLHDIGKNLVAMMWKGAGFNVVDLGVDVSADDFVAAVRENQADIVGVSALLTTTMARMSEVVEAMASAGLDTPVVIGGAPTTAEHAELIGASGHAPDAATAVDLARRVLA